MKSPRRRYRYKTWVKLSLAVFVLLIAFTILIKVLERPSIGTVRPAAATTETKAAEKPSTITARFFTLVYDGSMDSVTDISGGDSTALEVYRIARSDVTGRRTVVITIKQRPPDGLVGESSYRIRQNQPDLYAEKTVTFGEMSFITMEKSDGSELTGFTTYNDKLAMVSYTLASPNADLRTEATALLNQFRWLK
ncbi:MAG: hypothetical protein WAQ57_01945 [Candidatus Saccharimonadales bacterium]